MVETDTGRVVNGIDVDGLREYIDGCRVDQSRADRNPEVVARWVGGARAEVTSTVGGPPVYMGGDDDPSAMGMLLRAMAACDVEVVVNKAALLGVDIEELSVTARGYFNVRRFLGLEADSDSGYQYVDYSIRLRTRGATGDQLAEIRRACEHGSPVADTLSRHVRLRPQFDLE
jgi:uncharacterized OsmC-like protein